MNMAGTLKRIPRLIGMWLSSSPSQSDHFLFLWFTLLCSNLYDSFKKHCSLHAAEKVAILE